LVNRRFLISLITAHSTLNFSLDAKASSIQVTVKSGGLKLLQISDNGTGILKENLPILCERFTTSKLQLFDDLKSISTYGFRGDALASISMVSRLTVQTKTRKEACAYKSKYENGELIEGPTACAGNQGTIIGIEDLFYNVPIRQKTLKLPSDEFQKIYEVVSKYAVHNHTISFTLKKFNENNSIKTQPSSTPIEAIRVIYGNNIANCLLDVNAADESLKFTMNALITKPDYDGKKGMFLLFINHRLVESKALKKALFDDLYNVLFDVKSQPFIYMSLLIEPSHCDVNVHPTKNEVSFLDEELIIAAIKDAVEAKLMSLNDTRRLYTQQLLPGASQVLNDKSFEEKDRIYAKDMIRTDAQSQSIVKYLNTSGDENSFAQSLQHCDTLELPKREESKSQLTSISELREAIEKACDAKLREEVEQLKFVGISGTTKTIIQCENTLYITDTQRLCEELFYQMMITQFAHFDCLEMTESMKISELAMIGFDLKEVGWSDEDGSKEQLAKRVESLLMEHREMLKEYFSLAISDDAVLETLPLIIPDYQPLMTQLPVFIIRLATEIDYDSGDEKSCLKAIAVETANFYARLSLTADAEDLDYLMENVMLPEIRRSLQPPASMLNDGTFMKLTSLQELFKVFERC